MIVSFCGIKKEYRIEYNGRIYRRHSYIEAKEVVESL
jgi:hypothetical protein